MFDQSFSFILTIAALVVGFMLFTGHGSFFMKGGNTEPRSMMKKKWKRFQESV